MKKIANTIISTVVSLSLLAGCSVPVFSADDEYVEYEATADEQASYEDTYDYDFDEGSCLSDEGDDSFDNDYEDYDSQSFESESDYYDENFYEDLEYPDDDQGIVEQETSDSNTDDWPYQEDVEETESVVEGYEETIIDFGTESGITVAEASDPVIVKSGKLGSNISWTLDDAGHLIISGSGTIPNIQKYSLWDRRNQVYSIEIEPGITKVGDNAFMGFLSVSHISLPDTLEEIGINAFHYCSALETISIPGSVQVISKQAFEYCENLSEVVLNEGIKSIGADAFLSCIKLNSINIPATVDSINTLSFEKCSTLNEINVDQNNIAYSSDDGVLFNKDMTHLITVPAGKTGLYTVPETVDVVETFAFYLNNGITEIKFLNDNTELKSSAIAYCENLRHIDLPEKLLVIENGILSGCNELSEITIPASVQQIKDQAFQQGSKYQNHGLLTKIYFLGDAPTISSIAFISIIGTAWYPEGNDTWKDEVRQNYGGTITWKPYRNTFQVYLQNENDAEQLYTGSELRPVPIVKNNKGEILSENVDYTLTYSDNIEPGTATITANGIGSYANTSGNVKFEIKGKIEATLSSNMFLFDTSSGDYQIFKPSPIVSFKTTMLSPDDDYTVEYKDNTSPGKATVTVTGINKYTGEIEIPFYLVTVSGLEASYEYTEEEIEPAFMLSADKQLTLDTDYSVKYKDNINPGPECPQIIVSGKGEYSGDIYSIYY